MSGGCNGTARKSLAARARDFTRTSLSDLSCTDALYDVHMYSRMYAHARTDTRVDSPIRPCLPREGLSPGKDRELEGREEAHPLSLLFGVRW